MLDNEMWWRAVESKNASFDGKFFYGVVTTGVYCRPSCPSRLPLQKNVRFYLTPKEAEADGLRACLRCRPLAAIGGLAGLIRSTGTGPGVDDGAS